MSVADLTLDEHHVYRLRGRVVTGVTRVVDILRDVAKLPREVREDAGELGTLVHRATSLDARGELDEDSVDPTVSPYLDAWRLFMSEVKPKILSDEELVYHPVYDYAGTLDNRMLINGGSAIVDKKTGVEDEADAVQLSAYLEAKFHDDELARRNHSLYILSLRPNGKYKLRKHHNQFHVFLAALTCYRFKNGRK